MHNFGFASGFLISDWVRVLQNFGRTQPVGYTTSRSPAPALSLHLTPPRGLNLCQPLRSCPPPPCPHLCSFPLHRPGQFPLISLNFPPLQAMAVSKGWIFILHRRLPQDIPLLRPQVKKMPRAWKKEQQRQWGAWRRLEGLWGWPEAWTAPYQVVEKRAVVLGGDRWRRWSWAEQFKKFGCKLGFLPKPNRIY